MDSLMNKITGRLASTSSRRGFLGFLGKLALGGVAAGAGLALGGGGVALAAGLLCCTGTLCSTTNGCPSGTHHGYTWYCCTSGQCRPRACNDCYNSSGGYVCTYVTIQQTGGCC
jgi:hypothetical protein